MRKSQQELSIVLSSQTPPEQNIFKLYHFSSLYNIIHNRGISSLREHALSNFYKYAHFVYILLLLVRSTSSFTKIDCSHI